MEIIISVFLLFVGIAILVIIHICIVGRAYRREFGIDGVPVIKGAGMPIDDLKKLPCFEYKQQQSSENDNNNNENENEKDTSTMVASSDTNSTNDSTSINNCAVCLESFKVGDTCRILPNCHHYFHAKCVDVWLSKSPFCPVCRTCTIIAITKPPSSKMVVAPDGGAATVISTNVPSINNPAAEELC